MNIANTHTGTVYLVGAGPGAADLLTLRAHRILQSADIVLHDLLIPRELLDTIPESKLENVGKRGYGPRVPQSYTLDRMVTLAQEGLNVVRLKCGDPFVFGRGGEEATHLEKAGVPFEIVGGLSSALMSATSAHVPLTYRNVSQHFSVVTAHTVTNGDGHLVSGLIQLGGTVVVLMGVRAAPSIAEALLASGVAPSLPVAIVSRATHADEQVFETSVGDLAAFIEQNEVPRPATLIFGETVALRTNRDRPQLDSSYERTDMRIASGILHE